MKDRIICAARAAWYRAYEWPRLRVARFRNEAKYDAWNMDFKPLISVYIPTHNRVKLLMERALPSILAQKYDNIEIIVAAHGCTDRTFNRVTLEVDSPKVWVLQVPRKGTHPPTPENVWLAGAVEPSNAAIAAAHGEWIARCDDDDIWTPDHLQRLLYFAVQNGHEFVSSNYEREIDGKREVVKHDGVWPHIGGTQTWLYRSYLRFMRENPDCWRKKWNRVSDMDFADRIRKAGVRIGHLDKVTAYILPRPGEDAVGFEAVRRKTAQ